MCFHTCQQNTAQCDPEPESRVKLLLLLQGPTSGVYQEADRLQQLQQQQLQQAQQQQQRSVDSEALQLNASSSPGASAVADSAAHASLATSQDSAGQEMEVQLHLYMWFCQNAQGLLVITAMWRAALNMITFICDQSMSCAC